MDHMFSWLSLAKNLMAEKNVVSLRLRISISQFARYQQLIKIKTKSFTS